MHVYKYTCNSIYTNFSSKLQLSYVQLLVMMQLGFGRLFPKNHLLFYSFILRYWAHYSFKGNPLFSTWNTLCAVLSCVQYKNDVIMWSFLTRLISVIVLHHHQFQIVIYQQRRCHNAIISESCAYYSQKVILQS